MNEIVIPFTTKTIGLSRYRNRKPQSLLQAARHNLRDIQKELGANSHIDAKRIGLNVIMAGPDTPAGVTALALSLMAAASVDVSKLRKDYTQAHELLFTLAAATKVNPNDYFESCLRMVVKQFGAGNILSAIVHHDESAPHFHILIAPIAGDHYLGSSLIDRARLAQLRAVYATEVAPAFGLAVRPPLIGALRATAIVMIYERLESTLDAVLQSVLWHTVKAEIARNPAPYMARMGIEPEPKAPVNDGGKAFKRIALSTGKGGKTERHEKPYGFETGASNDVLKPYGFEIDSKNHRNPCSVGFHSKAQPHPAPPTGIEAQHDKPNATCAVDDSYEETTTRHRDCDQAPDRFQDGDYCAPQPQPARIERHTAGRWVGAALATRSKHVGTYRRLTAKQVGLFTNLIH